MAIVDRIFGHKKESLEITSPYVDNEDDCLSCRVLGSTALVSAGGYTYFSGMSQLRKSHDMIERSTSKYRYGSRQLGIVLLSAGFVSAGIYRMVN